MRKAIILFSLLSISVLGNTQADVTSAYNLQRDGKFEEAMSYINKAIEDPKASVKEKTWRYRGNIYIDIAKDPALLLKYPDALEVARQSYTKAMELDTKESYKQENSMGLIQVQAMANSLGMNKYEEGDFFEAAEYFGLSETVSSQFNVIDSLAIFNTALCYEKAGEIEKAIEGYSRCGEIGYQVPNVFLFVSNLQRLNGQEEEALKTLQEARTQYPNDKALIIEELNIYLLSGDFEQAQRNLELAVEKDPENSVLYFSMGSVYDNLGKTEEAEAAYKKALEINPDYFDANYNLGALYFNNAVLMVQEASEIPPSKIKEYNAKMEEVNKIFAMATPYLEKAYALNPDDLNTMRSLKDIYFRTGEDQKGLDMKKKIESMED